jgi:DNA-binding HxlR family transcriptional regulator
MTYRSGLEIKKSILDQLRKSEKVISQLERKLNTSDKVIKRHIEELEFLGIVKIIEHKKSPKTGRPYTSVKLK